jgi:phosphoglycolate phosphatase-like HAD superfamily hydrolase
LITFPKVWGTEKYNLISRTIEDFELSSLGDLEVLDDSPKLLMQLSSRYLLGLVTFQGKNVLKKILETLGILNVFHGMSSRDDAPSRIEQISQIVSSSNFKPKDFLVVGDRLNDVNSALDFGCKAIQIVRPLPDNLHENNPDNKDKKFIVIHSLQEIPSLIE